MKNHLTHIKKVVSEFLASEVPDYSTKHFLLGVSGGADSVLLTHVFNSLHLHFSIAHVNYNLRGNESIEDEKFVTTLAKKIKTKVFIKNVQAKAIKKSGESTQMLARKIRYDFFTEIMAENKIDYLVLAHHANDQIETVLMNIFRGCGLDGLTGMELVNKNTLRPLLNIKRNEIEKALKENKLAFRIDSSNLQNNYKRNHLRNVLIPEIETKWPGFEKTMLKNIELFKSEKKSIEKNNISYRFDFNKPFSTDMVVLIEDPIKLNEFKKTAVKSGFTLDMLNKLLVVRKNNESKIIACKNGKLENKNGKLFFVPAVNPKESIPSLHHKKNHLFISGLDTTFFKKTTEKISFNALKGELILRKWEIGDRMIPLGMTKLKKVSDILTDYKLTANQKSNVYLLCDSNKPLWLIGFRIDNRVKLAGNEADNEILFLSAI